MKSIQQEHEKVEKALKDVKKTLDEMRQEVVGYDYDEMYVENKLIPSINEIFGKQLVARAVFDPFPVP